MKGDPAQRSARGKTASKRRAPFAPSPARPRGRSREPSSPLAEDRDRLLLATIIARVADSTWTGPFSRRHPHLLVEVLGRSGVGRREIVADHWISGLPPGLWAREIASFPDVFQVDSLAAVGDGSLYRVRFRAPPVVDLYRRLELPLPFPIQIRAGVVRWEVVSRRVEFEAILRFARELDPRARVAWTRTPPLQAHLPLLSARQRALLHQAMELGYFAVPRRISLPELARESGRSKATVSEALALIEKKLLESAVREPILSRHRFELASGQTGAPRPASNERPLPRRGLTSASR